MRRNPGSERYALTLKLAMVAQRSLAGLTIPKVAVPVLDRLARATGERADLGVVDGEVLRFVACVDADRYVAVKGLVGHNAQVDVMASGRAWIAFLPQAEALRIVQGPVSDIPTQARPAVEALLTDLATIRARGYALAIDAVTHGVACAAAPVWAGEPRRVVATASFFGPAFRLDETRLAALVPHLFTACDDLSAIWPAIHLATTANPSFLTT